MPVQYNTIEDLIYALLMEIGLAIKSPEEILYDQDTMFVLTCGNKHIKASVDPNRPVFASQFTTLFDPLNFKIMNFFLSYYISKEESVNNFKVTAFSFHDNGLRGADCKSCIRVKFLNGSTIESGYYNNKALKICDVILRIGGFNVDLSNFDTRVIEDAI